MEARKGLSARPTGPQASYYDAAAHWDCITVGAAIALIRILEVAMPAEALRARIEANLAGQKTIGIVGDPSGSRGGDISAAMPRFVAAFIEQQFAS